MPIQLLISTFGASGSDYTRYLQSGSLQIVDQINVPTLCNFNLTNNDNQFVPPVQGAYVQVYSSTYNLYPFTGYISVTPERSYQGLSTRQPSLPRLYQWSVKCTSDEYLLNNKTTPFIPTFANQTKANILGTIADILAPGFFDVTSFAASGDIVPYYQYDPSQSWSALAKQFADDSTYRYKVLNKKFYFQPYGATPFPIQYDPSKGPGTFDPSQFKVAILDQPLVNDAIVIGLPEAGAYAKAFFIGDGFNTNFPLQDEMFRGDTQLLLQENWNGSEFNQQYWTVQDPGDNFSLFEGALNVIGGTGLGQSYILGKNGVELGGQLYLQHGEFLFTAQSTGLIGGVYTDPLLSASGCYCAFECAPSGASETAIWPFFNGVRYNSADAIAAGFPVLVNPQHQYVLITMIAGSKQFRYNRTYRAMEGQAFGGDLIPANGLITWAIYDINPLAPPITGSPWQYIPENQFPILQTLTTQLTVAASGMPGLGFYAPVNSTDLNFSANTLMIAQPPQCTLITYSEPASGGALSGAQVQPLGFGLLPTLQKQKASIIQGQDQSTSQLAFYTDSIPAEQEIIRLDYRVAQLAVARVQDPVSIAQQAALAGDDGHRGSIQKNLSPAPRSSEECDAAAQAFIQNAETNIYQGTYTVPYLFVNYAASGFPVSGVYMHVNDPDRDLNNYNFLVQKVTTTYIELKKEIATHVVEYGQDSYLQRTLNQFVNFPNLLRPVDTATPPLPQSLLDVGSAFLADLDKVNVLSLSCTGVQLDFGAIPASGVEVRTADLGWGTQTVKNLIGVFTSQQVTLQRTQDVQRFYMRMVNGGLTSRRTSIVHLNVPVPPPPITGLLNMAKYNDPLLLITPPLDTIDFFGMEVRVDVVPPGGIQVYSGVALSGADIDLTFENGLIDFGTNANLYVTGDWSAGLWIYLPSNAHGSLLGRVNAGTLIIQGEGSNAYSLSIMGSPPFGVIYEHDSYLTTSNVLVNFPDAGVPANQWLYLGASRVAATQTVTLYMSTDGKTMTTLGSGVYPSGSPPAGDGANAGAHMTLGDFWYAGGCNTPPSENFYYPAINVIAEAYMWDAALTSAQHLAAASGAPPSANLIFDCTNVGASPPVTNTSITGPITGVLCETIPVAGPTNVPDTARLFGETLGAFLNGASTPWADPQGVSTSGPCATVGFGTTVSASASGAPTIAQDQAQVGTIQITSGAFWNNQSNAINKTSANQQYTDADVGAGGQSDFIVFTGYEFALPTASSIQGVTVALWRKHLSGTSAPYTIDMQLVGVVGSDVKADPYGSPWPGTEAVLDYGSATDTWHAALNGTIVNSSGFGVALATDVTGQPGNGADCGVDFVSITLNYTYPVYGYSDLLQATHFGLSIPLNYTVLGFQAKITGSQTSTPAGTSLSVQLLQNGQPVGAAKTGVLPTATGVLILGNETDEWGASAYWTPQEVNQPLFGLQIQTVNTSGKPVTWTICKVEIDVYAGLAQEEVMFHRDFLAASDLTFHLNLSPIFQVLRNPVLYLYSYNLIGCYSNPPGQGTQVVTNGVFGLGGGTLTAPAVSDIEFDPVSMSLNWDSTFPAGINTADIYHDVQVDSTGTAAFNALTVDVTEHQTTNLPLPPAVATGIFDARVRGVDEAGPGDWALYHWQGIGASGAPGGGGGNFSFRIGYVKSILATTYTVQSADANSLLVMTNASQSTLTLPSSLGQPFTVSVLAAGAGGTILQPASGTIDQQANLTLKTDQGVQLFFDGMNWWTDGEPASDPFHGVNIQTGNYTITAADENKLVVYAGAASGTFLLPAASPSSTWDVLVENAGSGALILSPNGLKLDYITAPLVLYPMQGLQVLTDGTNYFSERGMGGSEAVIGFVMNSGVSGLNVGPMLGGAKRASVTRCAVIVKASDASVALTFRINQNGASVFTTNPTIAAGTASGSVLIFTALTSEVLFVNTDDVFSIDILAGSSLWNFTVQLET